MAEDRRPWDLHPALTAERLAVVARLIAAARRDAVAQAAWALGDDGWSVGCRAYAFARNRIARVAEGGFHPWLKVLDDSQHFVFLIDGVPVRFYRGPADDPTDRTLRRQEAEAQQLSLAFGGAAGAADLLFRLAVETDERGAATRVVFLALRGEDRVECAWTVPLDPARAAGPAAGLAALQLPLLHDGAAAAGPAAPRRPRRRAAA